jgi:hypothetical protein
MCIGWRNNKYYVTKIHSVKITIKYLQFDTSYMIATI